MYYNYPKGTAITLPERVLFCVRKISRHLNKVFRTPFWRRACGLLICTVIGEECICCLPLKQMH